MCKEETKGRRVGGEEEEQKIFNEREKIEEITNTRKSDRISSKINKGLKVKR